MRRSSRFTLRTVVRRTVFLLLVPAVMVLAIRLVWNVEANRRLGAVRAKLLAEGVRLRPLLPTVPDDQNAALAVIDAIHAIKLSPAESDLANDGDDPSASFSDISWTPAHLPELHRILAKNAEAFRKLRIAAKLPAARWPHTFAGIHIDDSRPIYYAREFADLLYDAALSAHEDHHDAEALDDLALIFHLARIFDQDPAEVSHIVAMALRSLAAAGVERLAPSLHLTEADGSLAAAQKLVPLLLNPESSQDQRAIAWEADLQFTSDQLHSGMPRFWQWWFRPLDTDETARVVANLAKEVPSVRADDWPAAESLLPRRGPGPNTILDVSVLAVSDSAVGTSFMYSQLHFRSLAATGAAAILLAARIYQSEHGYFPADAADLVPAMFPHLPIDPFDANHTPMRYRLDATGPTVWSVGENGTNENATVFPPGFSDYGNLQRYGGGSNPAHNPPDIVYGAAWRIAKAAAAAHVAASSAPAPLSPPGVPPP